MDRLGELTSRITDGWRNLNTVKKVSVVLGAISILVVMIITILVANKVDYAPLFNDLSEAEAGTIVKELDSQSIKYKVENNGSTILVDEKSRDKFRMTLAVDNKLPDSSTGFEIFDQTSMMATDEDRKIMYQRAVTGELQRAIEALEGVKKAKVMLVIPDKSIFEKKGAEASASLVLSLASGTKLSESSIQGIGSLVSAAVENLPTKNIKIVDESGNLLSNILSEGTDIKSTDLASKYQVIKQEFEQNLESKTSNLLGGVFEAEAIKLSVNVDLDFDSIEKTTVKYEKPEVRSENVKVAGANLNLQQVQGGNINENIGNVVGGNGQESNSYDHSVNNELDTETTTTINAPGVVRKVSASVLINQTLSPLEIRQLREIVQSAIGFDAARGDQVSIQGLKFNNNDNLTDGETTPTNTTTTLLNSEMGQKILLIIGGLMAVLLVLITLILVLRRGRPNEKTAKNPERKHLKSAQQVTDEELDVTGQHSPSVMPNQINESNSVADESLTNEGLRQTTQAEVRMARQSEEEQLIAQKEQELAQISTEKEQKAKQYAKENPDLAAELIKVWMKDK